MLVLLKKNIKLFEYPYKIGKFSAKYKHIYTGNYITVMRHYMLSKTFFLEQVMAQSAGYGLQVFPKKAEKKTAQKKELTDW